MIINAKQELLDIITSRNLTILKIEITYTHINWDDNTTITKNITTLDDLNFDYDAGYGSQELFGVVYCKIQIIVLFGLQEKNMMVVNGGI